MGDAAWRKRSRTAKRARERIKHLWDKGIVQYALHATERLLERGLDANDIQHVIRYGTITRSGPSGFPDTPRRYILEGTAVDGELLVCVVDTNGWLVVVTVYPRD